MYRSKKLAKAAHSLSADALGLDGFEILQGEEVLAPSLQRAGGKKEPPGGAEKADAIYE